MTEEIAELMRKAAAAKNHVRFLELLRQLAIHCNDEEVIHKIDLRLAKIVKGKKWKTIDVWFDGIIPDEFPQKVRESSDGFRGFWRDVDFDNLGAIIKAFKVMYDFPEVFRQVDCLNFRTMLMDKGYSGSRVDWLEDMAGKKSKFGKPRWVHDAVQASPHGKPQKVKSWLK